MGLAGKVLGKAEKLGLIDASDMQANFKDEGHLQTSLGSYLV